MDITIGADPELFVKKGGEFFSAYKLIPGTKEKPHPVESGAVQVDGMALEINVNPASDFKTFNHNINTVLATLRSMVPDDYEFDFSASAMFTKEHMAEQPEEARLQGCEPDMNAYTMGFNPSPEEHEVMRAAGGHIHVGWGQGFDVEDGGHVVSCARLAKQMDFLLGVPSLLVDPDVRRRKLYGSAGAFRPKPYGMEYRVLSNFWVNDPGFREWVFKQTQRSFNTLVHDHNEMEDRFAGLARTAIDDNNTGLASDLMNADRETFGQLPQSAA